MCKKRNEVIAFNTNRCRRKIQNIEMLEKAMMSEQVVKINN